MTRTVCQCRRPCICQSSCPQEWSMLWRRLWPPSPFHFQRLKKAFQSFNSSTGGHSEYAAYIVLHVFIRNPLSIAERNRNFLHPYVECQIRRSNGYLPYTEGVIIDVTHPYEYPAEHRHTLHSYNRHHLVITPFFFFKLFFLSVPILYYFFHIWRKNR